MDDARRRERIFPPQREPCRSRRTLPAMLDAAPAKQRNVIVRPHGPGVTFIQLDDLKADQLARLAPAVFLTLETSPGNFQAWVALPESEDKDFARRLRKGTGADATASGATSVAGSLNFKDKYAPEFSARGDPPGESGPYDDAAELERLGLVAAPEIVEPAACPLPARDRAAAIANGRAMPAVWTARRSTARKPAPTPAARILCGA